MESSNHNERSLYCPLRKKWVAGLPEEIIRQTLLKKMIEQLHFPLYGLAIEKALHEIPHLQAVKNKLPSRRADLICFGSGIHPSYPLFPLILIECKSVKITDEFIRQVIGYNQFIGAPFIALANEEEIRTAWIDSNERKYKFIPYLPSYEILIKNAQCVTRTNKQV